ncbi:hypothetical protein F5X68DRAFT_249113 [Plectosphaerella plurivora]|uniref:Protein kinase domain-containing protein n=1 Tax=Plectosphaerella plurivora TaxID=936078 RepID=A0A9P8V3J4_9PEZI|nr:hypothetical protein F5X68DRAFT_249113 [Plectosphaerella plurivora]
MAEEIDPLKFDVVPGTIWGDEAETIVYAQAGGNGDSLIFRFSLNPAKSPHSLPNRIVNCFHVIDEDDIKSTFVSRSDMRKEIWTAVVKVWAKCLRDEKNLKPGVIVDLDTNDAGDITWTAAEDPLFEKYLEFMSGIKSSDLSSEGDSAPVRDISEVIMLEAMTGRGAAKSAGLRKGQREQSPLIFRGIDFQTYLQVHDEAGEFSSAMLETWKRASRLIAGMTPHPNIQPPPKYLVSVTGPSGEPTLIGHLSTYSHRRYLSAVMETENENQKQIDLPKKAKWCHQMSLAVAHTHQVLKTYHMDICPQNFLLDEEQENLFLVDWEQNKVTAATLAPEADGTRDVKEVDSKLVYTEYDGPERSNMPEEGAQNGWNVFPEWQASCPRATELAEVFSLGRTMWMLLSREDIDFDEVEHPDDVEVVWGDGSLPRSWTKMIDSCMVADPNKRPSLAELVKFWEEEEAKLAGSA